MINFKKMSPGRIIVLGFALVVLTGTTLLYLPISSNEGVSVTLVDALFTATSAVCVTGLVAVDIANTFNIFGRTVVAILIQIGGLGVASIGVAFILLSRKNVGLKERILVKESMNLNSLQGMVRLVKSIITTTLFFEGVGIFLSFLVFSKDYSPLSALGISIFHSISAFNNAGFDILGDFKNLTPYKDNVLLNLTTCGLIIFGGLGFYAIREIKQKKIFKTFGVNTKIVITMTVTLLTLGTVLLKCTENISWLGAFFQSTSARTAGFNTYPLGDFSTSGLLTLIFLMFVGASPGSTGGGIKTTTAFVIFKSIYSISANKNCTAFKRKIPKESIIKAFVIMTLAGLLVCFNTFLICLIEPQYTFLQVLFETVSGFGTVGLSTGITPYLADLSKIILSFTMFCGRLGPLTMMCIWFSRTPSSLSYPEEKITIG
ncbi:TrkH family potassium uptake protein [Sporanaerobacter sp. PP17-6a]|uniref:TrkH family potassium uptake protein n=1 Tax=Sporanaerobacter sp. PP17-6a TaxID=1891289 RepID=UPI0008A02AB3|nr:potassium transporter TrkG [Sporanaerobacter sp. PP17-6a]SCL91137.1 Ktr system potassium uptake protein B [Sporanaerobacter sp. PP17-6a]